jgi:hypothetical protein
MIECAQKWPAPANPNPIESRSRVLSANLSLPRTKLVKFDQISPNTSISGACSIPPHKRRLAKTTIPHWNGHQRPLDGGMIIHRKIHWRQLHLTSRTANHASLLVRPQEIPLSRKSMTKYSKNCAPFAARWPRRPNGMCGMRCGFFVIFSCRSRFLRDDESITVDTLGQSVAEQPATRGQLRSGRYARSV